MTGETENVLRSGVDFLDGPPASLSGSGAVAQHGADVNGLAGVTLDVLAQALHGTA